MIAIDELIDFFEKINQEIDKVFIDLIKDNERFVIELNAEQLFAGIDNDGDKITPPYKSSTIKRKKRKGQPYNRVTTKDEGDHHASIFVSYDNNEDGCFELFADDFKTQYLVRKYGKKLYGLTEESIDKLRAVINDKLIESITKKFNNE